MHHNKSINNVIPELDLAGAQNQPQADWSALNQSRAAVMQRSGSLFPI